MRTAAPDDIELIILNLRFNEWFTEDHANRMRGMKCLRSNLDKFKGIRKEESFERMIKTVTMKTHCINCGEELDMKDAINDKGHWAHKTCPEMVNKLPVEASLGTPVRIENCHPDGKCMTVGEALKQIRDGKVSCDPTPLGTSAGWIRNPEWGFPDELIKDCPDAANIIAMCHEVCELLLKKNRAYGSSFRQGLNVFSKLSSVEAINARMDDKIARIRQAKDFSEDAELDLIGYLILKRIVVKEATPATPEPLNTKAGGITYNTDELAEVSQRSLRDKIDSLEAEKIHPPQDLPHTYLLRLRNDYVKQHGEMPQFLIMNTEAYGLFRSHCNNLPYSTPNLDSDYQYCNCRVVEDRTQAETYKFTCSL